LLIVSIIVKGKIVLHPWLDAEAETIGGEALLVRRAALGNGSVGCGPNTKDAIVEETTAATTT
jgi:hypothetical protein